METVANNKLIAEFLGMETMTRTQNGWEVAKFNFHNSWDSLMLAVEKIYSLDKYYEYKMYLSAFELELKDLFPNIEKVYEFCLEFIKWYNENK